MKIVSIVSYEVTLTDGMQRRLLKKKLLFVVRQATRLLIEKIPERTQATTVPFASNNSLVSFTTLFKSTDMVALQFLIDTF